jgi:hypothetical protein
MLSRKTLSKLLAENQFSTDPKRIGYEAFGRTVFAYVPVKDMTERAKLERTLRTSGVKPNPSYCVGHPVVEVQVSYFKAWHHDE